MKKFKVFLKENIPKVGINKVLIIINKKLLINIDFSL